MKLIEVKAQEVRLPTAASDALAEGTPVAVTRYGEPVHVVLSQDQFARVAPLLELLDEGATVSPEMLMSREDIALERELADDRESPEAEEEQIHELLGELPA